MLRLKNRKDGMGLGMGIYWSGQKGGQCAFAEAAPTVSQVIIARSFGAVLLQPANGYCNRQYKLCGQE